MKINEPNKTSGISRRSALASGLAAAVLPATIAQAQSVGVGKGGPSSVLQTAWDRYMATLEEMRRKIEGSGQFAAAPEQQALGYHALMEVQAQAYNFAVAPELAYPRMFHNTTWQTEIYTLGGNGADFDYHSIFLDGAQTYRLTVKPNDSRMLLGQLNNALPGTSGSKILANYDFESFTPEKDGRYDVVLSASRQSKNWIGLDPVSGYQWIQFRPTVETWDAIPASLSIERTSKIEPDHYSDDLFDPSAIARRINMATDFARYVTEEWTLAFTPRVRRNAGGANIFATIGTEISGEVGSPTARYVMADYELGDDEALLVELPEDPGGAYWSFQIFDVWLRSINFRTRQTSLNHRQLARDSDGRFHLVLSRQDPGIANWLDTVGFSKGMILLRNYRSPKAVVPNARRVKFAELAKLLPHDTKRVTPVQRAEELERRRAAYLRRHGE